MSDWYNQICLLVAIEALQLALVMPTKERKFDGKPLTIYPYDYMLVWMSKHLELPARHVWYENIPWPMFYSRTIVT